MSITFSVAERRVVRLSSVASIARCIYYDWRFSASYIYAYANLYNVCLYRDAHLGLWTTRNAPFVATVTLARYLTEVVNR